MLQSQGTKSAPASQFYCDHIALHGIGPVSLTVAQGKTTAVTGPSGCGKSLLLRALADLLPHEGELYLNNQNANQFAPEQWRQKVGYLPSESQWWYENINQHFTAQIPGQIPAQTNIENELKQLNLPDAALQWQVARCSTGEKQRLALLRLLVRKPQVLLLDEPTANVDAGSVLAMESLIKEYQQLHNSPIIWVSHNDEQISRIADEVFMFDQGNLTSVNSW